MRDEVSEGLRFPGVVSPGDRRASNQRQRQGCYIEQPNGWFRVSTRYWR
jgi:hypothetical protein